MPVLLALFLLPTLAEAQLPRGPRPESRPRVLELGAKIGLESTGGDLVLGLQGRLPIDPWKRLEIMPGGWVQFQDRFTEYQLDADMALMLDRRGALYAGAGAAFRNTVYEFDEEGEPLPREFRTGYNLFVGLRSPAERSGEIGVQLELRWVDVDPFDLQVFSLGANWPVAIF